VSKREEWRKLHTEFYDPTDKLHVALFVFLKQSDEDELVKRGNKKHVQCREKDHVLYWRRSDNIKIDFQVMLCGLEKWSEMAQGKFQWR
jgi:hypothetical protein